MDLVLTGSSPLPIYRQLFDQLCGQILDGRLKSGLESAGFIESFVGRGCFIAPMSADKLQRLKREMAADKLSDAAACCQGLGLTLQEAEALLREAWEPKA